MKTKLTLLLGVFTLLTACNNDDSNETSGTPTGPPSFHLNNYSYHLNTTDPATEITVSNRDFHFNQNMHDRSTLESLHSGISSNENTVVTRNSSNQITEITSSNGAVINRTSVSYIDANISEITHVDYLDNSKNYTYNFEYNDNTTIRTEVGTNKEVHYIFGVNFGRLFNVTKFEDEIETSIEGFGYDTDGNCTGSNTFIPSSTTSNRYGFTYDENINPLKDAFENDLLFMVYNNNHNNSFGTLLAQFFSPSLLTSIKKLVAADEIIYDFNIEYDEHDRIISRSGNFEMHDFNITQNETFNYIN